MSGRRPVVHLIDAHVYIFRAWASLPPMPAPDGRATGAAYGFAGSLIRHLGAQAPSHVAVCFDHDMTSFRNELEPGYKAQRGEPPPELEAQFALCAEVADALGLAVFSRSGYEADDLIATLSQQLVEHGADALVVTTDKDLAQLVREDGRVELFDLAKEVRLGADAVRAKFGVGPAQIPDWLGLVGDAVDNLPGVPGIGAKTASALLSAFGRIEDVAADPAAWGAVGVRGAARLAALVDAHRERALRTRRLATLVRDVPGLRAEPADLEWSGALRREIGPLFDRLGWGAIRDRIPRWAD